MDEAIDERKERGTQKARRRGRKRMREEREGQKKEKKRTGEIQYSLEFCERAVDPERLCNGSCTRGADVVVLQAMIGFE